MPGIPPAADFRADSPGVFHVTTWAPAACRPGTTNTTGSTRRLVARATAVGLATVALSGAACGTVRCRAVLPSSESRELNLKVPCQAGAWSRRGPAGRYPGPPPPAESGFHFRRCLSPCAVARPFNLPCSAFSGS